MQALIVVDIQNDFLPGGALAVRDGDQIVPVINQLMEHFALVVASKDWHPPHHISFASTHGKKVGELIEVAGFSQILWPDHCVQNSFGAQFPSQLKSERIDEIFHKGIDPQIDSYSCFFDNAKRRSTGLHEYLEKAMITDLFFCGIATDYCVLYSVLDALELGYRATVITDACKAVNLKASDGEEALAMMATSGASLALSSNLY